MREGRPGGSGQLRVRIASGRRHVRPGFGGQACALELDRAVSDLEFMRQDFAYASENLLTVFHVHVGNADVAGERVQIRAERPDVDVMHLHDTVNPQQGGGDFLEVNFPRQTLEENVAAFAQNSGAGPQDHRADAHSDHGIEPGGAGPANAESADHDGDVGKSVAQIVDPDAANVEVAATAMDGEGDASIDDQSEKRDPQHDAGLDFDRVAQAQDRFIEQAERHDGEQHGIHKRGQDSRAVIAVGFLRSGRAPGPAHGKPGDDQRRHVGQVMHGIADERDGMACISGREFHGDERKGGHDGQAQNPGQALAVQVHVRMPAETMSVVSVAVGFVLRRTVGVDVHALDSTRRAARSTERATHA